MSTNNATTPVGETSEPPAGLSGDVNAEHEANIRRVLRAGDTITHTRCMGCIEEHIFTHYGEGKTTCWLYGKPTRDTIRLGGSNYVADDISFSSVTHINRIPVDVCIFAVEFRDRLTAPNEVIEEKSV